MPSNEVLNPRLARTQRIYPTSARVLTLIPATQCRKIGGPYINVLNAGTSVCEVRNNASALLFTLNPSEHAKIFLTDNSSAAGVWRWIKNNISGRVFYHEDLPPVTPKVIKLQLTYHGVMIPLNDYAATGSMPSQSRWERVTGGSGVNAGNSTYDFSVVLEQDGLDPNLWTKTEDGSIEYTEYYDLPGSWGYDPDPNNPAQVGSRGIHRVQLINDLTEIELTVRNAGTGDMLCRVFNRSVYLDLNQLQHIDNGQIAYGGSAGGKYGWVEAKWIEVEA